MLAATFHKKLLNWNFILSVCIWSNIWLHDIWHMSRQWRCRGMSKISLWYSGWNLSDYRWISLSESLLSCYRILVDRCMTLEACHYPFRQREIIEPYLLCPILTRMVWAPLWILNKPHSGWCHCPVHRSGRRIDIRYPTKTSHYSVETKSGYLSLAVLNLFQET